MGTSTRRNLGHARRLRSRYKGNLSLASRLFNCCDTAFQITVIVDRLVFQAFKARLHVVKAALNRAGTLRSVTPWQWCATTCGRLNIFPQPSPTPSAWKFPGCRAVLAAIGLFYALTPVEVVQSRAEGRGCKRCHLLTRPHTECSGVGAASHSGSSGQEALGIQ